MSDNQLDPVWAAAEIARLRATLAERDKRIARLEGALRDARAQIEYLDPDLSRGTTVTTLVRIDYALGGSAVAEGAAE